MATKTGRPRPIDCCSQIVPPAPMATGDLERTLALYKALADGTRLQIFRLIAAQDAPICACDVVDRFDVSQPTIAHHLKILRDAGLITVSRRGIWAYYAVDPRGLDRLRAATGDLVGAGGRAAAVG